MAIVHSAAKYQSWTSTVIPAHIFGQSDYPKFNVGLGFPGNSELVHHGAVTREWLLELRGLINAALGEECC